MIKQPQNLFKTKHFWGIIFTFYIASISPAIEKTLNDKLTNRDKIDIINSLVVGLGAASLKILDEDVYTPKGVFGKDKNQAIINCNSITTPIINSVIPQEIAPVMRNIINNEVNSTATKEINNIIDNATLGITNLLNSNNNSITNYKIICTNDTWLKDKSLDSSIKEVEKIKLVKDSTIFITSYEKKENNHLRVTKDNKSYYLYIPHIKLYENEIEIILIEPESIYTGFIPTKEQCNSIYNAELTNNEYSDLVNCLKTFNINTQLDVAHFLSQTAHESGGLRYLEEIASGQDYEGREDLGNIESGDGKRYKG